MDRSPGLLSETDGSVISQPLEANNLAFYTTIVSSGHARGVVIAVGDRTVMGQIAGRVTVTRPPALFLFLFLFLFFLGGRKDGKMERSSRRSWVSEN